MLAFLLLLGAPLYANAAATLVVTVKDANGQPISGAQVVLDEPH